MSNNYQSNGACSQSCAGYAFAVVQYTSCWCSNYIPAVTTSSGSCAVPCPGYPYENCGNEASGLFGYVALGKAPLGTKGAVASSSTTQAPSVTPTTQVIQSTPQVVSTRSGPPSILALASSSAPSISPMLEPSLPFPGSSTSISPSVSFQTQFLTQSVQNSPSNPSPVTVQNTVTASQSVQVSYVSIVWLCFIISHRSQYAFGWWRYS